MGHLFRINRICARCGTSQIAANHFGFPCAADGVPAVGHRDVPARLTLAEYRKWVRDVPHPTELQRHHFADYVAHAHSWYKHLSLTLPGHRFQFYLNPHAAMDRGLFSDGHVEFLHRDTGGPHYAKLATDRHRERFGFLDFATCDPALHVFKGVDRRRVTVRLPEEIVRCGTVELTAACHTWSSTVSYWHNRPHATQGKWPDESGGQAALDRIFARCREMRPVPSPKDAVDIDPEYARRCPKAAEDMVYVDPVLHELFLPERERQYREMVQAIDRVCALVAGRSRKFRVVRNDSGK